MHPWTMWEKLEPSVVWWWVLGARISISDCIFALHLKLLYLFILERAISIWYDETEIKELRCWKWWALRCRFLLLRRETLLARKLYIPNQTKHCGQGGEKWTSAQNTIIVPKNNITQPNKQHNLCCGCNVIVLVERCFSWMQGISAASSSRLRDQGGRLVACQSRRHFSYLLCPFSSTLLAQQSSSSC